MGRLLETPGAQLIVLEQQGAVVGAALLQPLSWDSAIFQMPMARLAALHFEESENETWVASMLVDKTIKAAQAGAYAMVDCHPDLNDLTSVHALTRHGFQLMATHLNIVWDLKRTPTPPFSQAVTVVSARETDAECVGALAQASMPPYNRFLADPQLHNKAADVFRHWGENAVRGYADCVHIALLNERPAGYCTWKKITDANGPLGQSIVSLDLTAVLPEARGRGLLKALVHEGLSWARQENYDYAYVLTHALNTGMQHVCGGIFDGRTLTARHNMHWQNRPL